ncbi:TPA: chitinase [Providencia rettgeri]|uniref:chitinase n=1 Tax=unclassified Providencia TaxID=2633465 RepID=UPI001BA378DB|nr:MULTISPECIES: chitinase [unclassified Providencia]EMB5787006.1 chitinase [Providencia rettgeri]HBC7431501.1 chitinase [Providencia rettgeri]
MHKTYFGPYMDVSVDATWNDWQNYPNGRPNAKYSQAAIKYGVDILSLGFLTATLDKKAAWSAQPSMPISWAKPLCDELIAGGVKVAVSFGGAANQDVSLVQTQEQLINTYQEAIDTLSASHIDLDFENGLYDADNAFSALKVIVDNNPQITLSLTLPTMPTGLTSTGLALVKKSVDAGLMMKVNGMAMDYYDPNITSLGDAAVKAANSIKNQLKPLYPGIDDNELYNYVQITPMIGLNDDLTMFNFNDVNILAEFAKNNGLNLVSMWSLTRDRPGNKPFPEAISSGNPEQTYEFEYTDLFTQQLNS